MAQDFAAAFPPIWYPPSSGEYTTGLFNTLNGGSTTWVADRITASPIVLPTAGAYDAIAVHVDVAVNAKHVRMGIFADNRAGRPGALIEDTGQITLSGTAAVLITGSFAAARTLRGLYWLGAVHDDVGINFEVSSTTGSYPIAVTASGTDMRHNVRAWSAHTYGALPATFGTATLQTTAAPRFVLRVA